MKLLNMQKVILSINIAKNWKFLGEWGTPGDLKSEIGVLLDSVNKRSQLEEHIINIGLSNNYFKNVG